MKITQEIENLNKFSRKFFNQISKVNVLDFNMNCYFENLFP